MNRKFLTALVAVHYFFASTVLVTASEATPAIDKANVKAPTRIMALKEPLQRKISEWDQEIESEKRRVFSPALLKFDAHVRAYHENKMPLGAYLKYLAKHSSGMDQSVKIYLTALRDLGQKTGVNIKDYPSKDELLEAVARMEVRGYKNLASSVEQRRLISQSKQLILARKLTNFELTPNEWKEYARLPLADAAPFEKFYQNAFGNQGGAFAWN
jgi:hypothetical protein